MIIHENDVTLFVDVNLHIAEGFSKNLFESSMIDVR